MSAEFSHRSVLLDEAVDELLNDKNGIYIDGTFGRGGHSSLILSRLGEQAKLLAFDKDPEAIAIGAKLAAADDRFEIVHRSFADIGEVVTSKGWEGKVAGILLDLGVSSPQLDDPQRGFSFMQEGPLDMRMNNSAGQTAAEWLNTAAVGDIAEVLRDYGEERHSRRLAKAIVEAREIKPLETTRELAQLIEKASPKREKHKHPATRSFQAIRIYINRELEELKTALDASMQALSVGGHLAVISFHSLEDRIVKQFIRQQEKGDELPRGLPIRDVEMNRKMKTRVKARKASAEEIEENARARSAVFRVAEKIA